MTIDSGMIRRRLERHSVYLQPPDELDLATVEAFADRLGEIRADEDVVVDLRHVTFCSAAGLRVLLQAQLDAETIGATLTLSHPTPEFERLLELAGLAEAFTIKRPAPARARRISGTDGSRR